MKTLPTFLSSNFSGLRNFQKAIPTDISRHIAFLKFGHWVIKGLQMARIWKPSLHHGSDLINLMSSISVIRSADAPNMWQHAHMIRKIFRSTSIKLFSLATKSSLSWWRESVYHYTHLVFATVKQQDTHPTLTKIEGSWFSTLQIRCALNSAISTPTTQWRTPSNKPTAMWRRFEIHHTAAPYTSAWQLSQHSQNQRLLACHTHKTNAKQTSSLHFRFVKMTVNDINHTKLSISANTRAN